MTRYQKSLLTAGLLLLVSAASSAIDGRDFAAFFAAADVTPVGEDVVLTFSADLYNYSDEDVVGATVKLSGFLFPETYATFPSVDVADRARVRLTREITLPAAEHQAWERGLAPCLTVEFLDAAGESRHSPAEMAPAILMEEEP